MPTRQSTFFTGSSRRVEPEVTAVGEVVTAIIAHNVTADITTADVLELFRMGPGMKIIGFDFVTENMPAANVSFGFMTGTPGDAVSARTCGTEIMGATAVAGPASATLLTLAKLAARPTNGDYVSIGMTTSASITAAANRWIYIRIQYTMLNPA